MDLHPVPHPGSRYAPSVTATARGMRRWLCGCLFALALLPAAAHAQLPQPSPYVYVGFSSQIGLDLTGVKLFAGYNFVRGDIQAELYAGALAIPPGPGAGVGIAGKYYVLDGETWRGALGGQLGVRLGGWVAPVAQLIAQGEARKSLFAGYLYLKTGFPQVFGAGLGGKMSFAQRTVWLEANTGIPLLINGELGYSTPPF